MRDYVMEYWGVILFYWITPELGVHQNRLHYIKYLSKLNLSLIIDFERLENDRNKPLQKITRTSGLNAYSLSTFNSVILLSLKNSFLKLKNLWNIFADIQFPSVHSKINYRMWSSFKCLNSITYFHKSFSINSLLFQLLCRVFPFPKLSALV